MHAGPGTTGGVAGPAGAGVRRPRPAARPVPRTRKARLRVAKADPWSVMKVSFLLSIALGICTIVAVAVLWMVLDTIGVFTTVGSTISEATTSEQGGKGGFDLVSFLSLSRVLTITTVIAVIDVVLATALATLGGLHLQPLRRFRGRYRAHARRGRVADADTDFGTWPSGALIFRCSAGL